MGPPCPLRTGGSLTKLFSIFSLGVKRMASLNKVILIGNLGRDPEIKAFQNGDRIANFSIATSEKWTDKATLEKKEVTHWHRITVRNQNIVTVVDKYVTKGSSVCVEGKLTYRKYMAGDGTEKVSTEIVIDPFNGNLLLMGSKEASVAEQAGMNKELDDEVPF
tara:strand:- start:595 stop:1083 length:489 start_codon:yes stop_codon:yes gene_type:complete